MTAAMTPAVPGGLAAWADRARVGPRPEAMTAARAAMHAVRLQTKTAPALHRRRFRVVLPRLDGLRRHPLALTAGSVAAAAALVVTAGWNAGPGSPLHTVQLAREDASLVFASVTQAGELRLDYAEARLRDAASGTDRRDNLEEAAALLNAVRPDLPMDHNDPLWLRWSHDESVLGALRAVPQSTAPSTGPPASGRGHDDGATAPNGSDDGGAVSGQSGDGGGGGTSSGDRGSSSMVPDGGNSSGSGSGESPAAAPTSDEGVDGRGGRGGSGGGPSTAPPAPSGDGGGGS